jgi:uncharacterized protein (TIGR03032 family)
VGIDSIPVSDSFLATLSDNCILAICTYRSGSVLFLQADPTLGAIWLEMKLQIPSGISTHADILSVATIDKIEDFSLSVLFAEFRRAKELRLGNGQCSSAQLAQQSMLATGKILCHEVIITPTATTYYVNTRHSAISAATGGVISEQYWSPPFITEWQDTDFCHLNGIAVSNGEPQVATCLAGANFAYGWRLFPYNSGLLMDIQANTILCKGLSLPHSPRCVGNLVYFLESGASSLSTLCLKTGKTDTLLKIPGFARGMAIHGNYAFIGISYIRDSNLWKDLPVKQEFPDSAPGIVVVDLIGRRIVSSLCFNEAVYEIFDVQLLAPP